MINRLLIALNKQSQLVQQTNKEYKLHDIRNNKCIQQTVEKLASTTTRTEQMRIVTSSNSSYENCASAMKIERRYQSNQKGRPAGLQTTPIKLAGQVLPWVSLERNGYDGKSPATGRRFPLEEQTPRGPTG